MKTIFSISLLSFLFTANIHAQCWQQVAAGRFHSVAIKMDGSLWTWGSNEYGQLGDGTLISKSYPIKIGISHDWKLVASALISDYNLAIKHDGTLWAWGRNSFGQLGTGNNTDHHTPTKIGTEENWQQVAAGVAHVAAIKSDGTLWAWGNNEFGQLGTGDNAFKNNPVQIGTDTDWEQVASGEHHTLAIKEDGTLWAWGLNFFGQLGNGTNTDEKAPIQIGTGSNWKQVVAGLEYSVAIDQDGNLYSWGRNFYGSLGDGSNSDKKTPVQIGPPESWEKATACVHTMAIKKDGTLWAWGDNFFGQLGLGYNNDDENSPHKVGSDDTWQQIAAGGGHSIGIQTGNAFWTWGANYWGQLGNSSNIDLDMPNEWVCPVSSTEGLFSPVYDLQIIPNPAQDHISFQFTHPKSTGVTLMIRDLLGEVLFSAPSFISGEQIDISSYAEGIYFLTVSDKLGYGSVRFVKM